MKTLKEETPSEAACGLDEEAAEMLHRTDRTDRTYEMDDFARRVALDPGAMQAMHPDRRGWRRPSAPSIFHNLEYVRRPSLTIPAAPNAPLVPIAASPMQSLQALPPAASSTVALRRPSAVVLVTTSNMPAEEKLRSLVKQSSRRGSSNSCAPLHSADEDSADVEQKFDDTISVYLSAMYAKLLVTLGIAFPITQTIATDAYYYQGFHLYLYVGTFVFLSCTYAEVLQSRAVMFVANSYNRKSSHPRPSIYSMSSRTQKSRQHYGSFYLRLGAIAFGIGSMVFSGLEFGQYWELGMECRKVTQALTPAARMVLTLIQMQFIFLSNKQMASQNSSIRQKLFAQFGLMHMIATNLCEWLTVIIEEAKHEIEHLPGESEENDSSLLEPHHGNSSNTHAHHLHCSSTSIISSLVRNASPFLFPCTIEYSLICAVVLFEMWKNTHRHSESEEHEASPPRYQELERSRSAHHLSVDCTKAHKGMFGGIVIVVLTIISLILFYVLQEAPGFQDTSLLVVGVCELCLYLITGSAVLAAFYKMRMLKHNPNIGAMNLDNTLLVIAQTGVFLYNLFSILAYASSGRTTRNLVAEMLGLIQTIGQTIFVLDSSTRRCRTSRESRHKPGRQLVTFLLVANMAMWIVNTLEKGRASSRPNLLAFYGNWPWTLIVHISMPLAIFYRFHSTICLFEIWKSCYKLKPQHSRQSAPVQDQESEPLNSAA